MIEFEQLTSDKVKVTWIDEGNFAVYKWVGGYVYDVTYFSGIFGRQVTSYGGMALYCDKESEFFDYIKKHFNKQNKGTY